MTQYNLEIKLFKLQSTTSVKLIFLLTMPVFSSFILGILRDISFQKMKDTDWELINKVHVFGAYKCTRAAWNVMKNQKFGRIINTASAAGLFGNFGQVNYSTAKLALHGFTQALAKEGQKYNIYTNTIAPLAASRMLESVMPPDYL
jgi:multifunctional beta-oxidation protein